MKCPYCGTETRDDARFCPQCGSPLGQPAGDSQETPDRPRRRRRSARLEKPAEKAKPKRLYSEAERDNPGNYEEETGAYSAEYRQLDGEGNAPFEEIDFGESESKIPVIAAIAMVVIALFIVLILFIAAHMLTGRKGNERKPGTGEAATEELLTDNDNKTEGDDDLFVEEDKDQNTDQDTDADDDDLLEFDSAEDDKSGKSESSAMDIAEEGLRTAEPIEPLEFNGHVYAIYNFHDLGLKTFDECEEYCKKMGGHLAVIDSEEENTAVYQYLSSNDREHTFIGLTDQDEEGDWVWADQSEVVYTNWAPGQPNNKTGNEHYAQYSGDEGGTWNDAEFGSGSWRFLCEWEVIYF